MKTLAIALIVSLPLFLSAQQKSDSQDLQKQIDQLKKELYFKISVLQDSLRMLQQQLQVEERPNPGFKSFSDEPLAFDEKARKTHPDRVLRKHSFNGERDLQVPEPPAFDYHLIVPPGDLGYFYNFNYPPAPPCPEIHEQKQKHEWMKMLPFGNLFKSKKNN